LELMRLAANNPVSAWGRSESRYEEACRIAASKVGLRWDEITVVAEREAAGDRLSVWHRMRRGYRRRRSQRIIC
jgi:hypothetical protein